MTCVRGCVGDLDPSTRRSGPWASLTSPRRPSSLPPSRLALLWLLWPGAQEVRQEEAKKRAKDKAARERKRASEIDALRVRLTTALVTCVRTGRSPQPPPQLTRPPALTTCPSGADAEGHRGGDAWAQPLHPPRTAGKTPL